MKKNVKNYFGLLLLSFMLMGGSFAFQNVNGLSQKALYTEEANNVRKAAVAQTQKTLVASPQKIALTDSSNVPVDTFHKEDMGIHWYKEATMGTPYGDVTAFTIVLDGSNVSFDNGRFLEFKDKVTTENCIVNMLIADNTKNSFTISGYDSSFVYAYFNATGVSKSNCSMNIIGGSNSTLEVNISGRYASGMYFEGIMNFVGGDSKFVATSTDTSDASALGGVRGTYLKDGAKLYAKATNTSNEGNAFYESYGFKSEDVIVTKPVNGYANGTNVFNSDGSIASEVELTQSDIQLPESVVLNKTTLNLKVDEEETLQASVTPANTNNKTIEWSTSDATIATVDNTGKVKGLKDGSVTITATCQTKSATCTVTVTKNVVFVPTISVPASIDTNNVEVGSDVALTTNIENAIWTTSDATIATVDSTGKVRPLKEGTVTITATSSSDSNVKNSVKLVFKAKNNENNNTPKNNGATVGIIIGILVLLLIAAYVCGYFFLYKKGKLDDKAIKVIYKFLPRGEKTE